MFQDAPVKEMEVEPTEEAREIPQRFKQNFSKIRQFLKKMLKLV